MATRPLYNGSARCGADNNAAPALLVRFVFRASVAAVNGGDELVDNASFEAEAGQTITLNYDIRKFGGGVETGTPDTAVIRIFNDDDSNDARAGAVATSADLIGGNALPRTGTFDFTPTKAGTYRIQLEMESGNGDFGAASDDWRIISDGAFNRGGVATPTTARYRDKGRLRYGMQVTALEVADEAGGAPPGLFAFTTNAGGTAAEEAVRLTTTQSHEQNKATSRELLRFAHRRNGTTTTDAFATTALVGTTQHRTTTTVTQVAFPNAGASQIYDTVITTENVSALHANNTRQYDGLGGQAAHGAWVYFTAATSPLSLVDFRTVEELASHTVDAGGSVENVFATHSSTYSEDVNGVPTSSEEIDYVATDQNMTVKSGRVLNARGEPLLGVFISTQVDHEDSGVSRDSWGMDDPDFATTANGWQDDPRVVTVSTPPSGVHSVKASAYFPSGSLGVPGSRQFFAVRTEAGAPASVDTGKNWIAPASFSNGVLIVRQVPKGGQSIDFTLKLSNKDDLLSADSTPVARVYKNRGTTLFATPVLTERETGVYDGSFTPDLPVGGTTDVYEITITATASGFTRRYGDTIEVMPFELYLDRFDPSGLFK